MSEEDPFAANQDDPFGAQVADDGAEQEQEEEQIEVNDDEHDPGQDADEDPFGAHAAADEGEDGHNEEQEDGEEEVAQGYGDGDDPFGAAGEAGATEEDPFGAAADEGEEQEEHGDDDQAQERSDEEGSAQNAPEDDDEPAPPRRGLANAFKGHTGGLRRAPQRKASSSNEDGDHADDEQHDGTDDGGSAEHDETPADDSNNNTRARMDNFKFGDAFGDYDAQFVDEEEGAESIVESEKSEAPEGAEVVPVYIPEDAPVEVERTYPEWDAAPLSTKFFSILEPGLTVDMEQPPLPWAITVTYHCIYLAILLANGFANIAGTYMDFTEGAGALKAIKTVATIAFMIDLVIRAPLVIKHGKPRFYLALVLDTITSISEVIILANVDIGFYEIVYFPPLRSTRVFLFTGLFIRTETFQDINIAIRTVVDSIRSLIVFVVLVLVGILVFATFVFLTERGSFNVNQQLWYRDCNVYLAKCAGVEVSPFQSIPDAMWLIVQSMTTVGYGDATPTTTLGRVVTGAAIIGGVFVIAFPSMVLIGNLDQSRRDFFAQQERAELEKEYRDLESQLETATSAEDTHTATMQATRTIYTHENDDDEEEEEEEFVELVPTSKLMLFGVPPSQHGKEQALKNRADFTDGAVTHFSFMGNARREVRHQPKGYWTYDPIFQVLADPEDGLPLLSNISPTSDGGFVCVMTLILDDPEAQALAIEAIEALDQQEHEPMAHADVIYGFDVTFKRPVPNVFLRRRVTVGQVHDHTLPITLELLPTDSVEPKEFLLFARRGISRAQLLIRYNKQPVTCTSWKKNIPITSVMLSTTPFIQDLKAIAVNIAPREYWSSQLRTEANDYSRQRRNVAYVSRPHLQTLVYPIFRKVVSQEYTLRNVTQFTEAVANMVTLHCREVRKHDVPEQLRIAIYQDHLVPEHERIFEVDIDYFRTLDWPLGTAPCEFTERCFRNDVLVKLSECGKLEQPIIADIDSFRRADVNEGAMDHGGDIDVFGADF